MRIGPCITHLAKPTVFMDRRLARYERLAHRLILSTPKAYDKLLSDPYLLRKLNDHFSLTGRVNVELLALAGFEVYPMQNRRAFGISLPAPADRDLYDECSEKLVVTTGEVARELFDHYGIQVVGIEKLKTGSELLALHRLIQFAIEDKDYNRTAAIVLDFEMELTDIYRVEMDSDGRATYLISASLLKKESKVLGAGWPKVVDCEQA